MLLPRNGIPVDDDCRLRKLRNQGILGGNARCSYVDSTIRGLCSSESSALVSPKHCPQTTDERSNNIQRSFQT